MWVPAWAVARVPAWRDDAGHGSVQTDGVGPCQSPCLLVELIAEARASLSALCSLLNLPHKRDAHVMLWIFRTVFLSFFFPGGCFRWRGRSETMCPGSVYPPEVSCQWLAGLNASRFQRSYCAHCAIIHFLPSLLFCTAPFTVTVLWQGKKYIYPTRDQMYLCCRVLDECKQTAEKKKNERVGHGLKECST